MADDQLPHEAPRGAAVEPEAAPLGDGDQIGEAHAVRRLGHEHQRRGLIAQALDGLEA